MKTAKTPPTIILGLSGGPDSVYLLHALKPLHDTKKINLVAAHLNHEWRTEAAAESAFCASMCKELSIPFIAEKASSLPITVKSNGSKEEVGRKLRRFFLEHVAQEHNASLIAIAHHKDDQYETFFMRLARGASIAGLGCMREIHGMYVRPLLNVTKQEILKYLAENSIPFVHDQSNDSDDFLRNRIRKYLMPALERCDARFSDKLATTIASLQADNDFLDNLTKQAFDSVFRTKLFQNHTNCEKGSIDSEKCTGSLPAFKELNKQIQQRLIIQWLVYEKIPFKPSAAFMQEIILFLSHERGGSHVIGSNVCIIKKRQQFWIESMGMRTF